MQQKSEELVVSNALKLNGYPQKIIKQHKRPLKQSISDRSLESPQKDPVAIISLPYIQGISESIRRALSRLDVKVSFYLYYTVRQMLLKPKDHIPRNHQKGVVYRIGCKDCPQSYIGQSGCSLQH